MSSMILLVPTAARATGQRRRHGEIAIPTDDTRTSRLPAQSVMAKWLGQIGAQSAASSVTRSRTTKITTSRLM